MTESKRKRPIAVWIIGILCILTAISQLMSHSTIISGRLEYEAQMQEYVNSWSLLDKVFPYILSILLLASAVSLVAMKRKALHLFGAYFVLVLLATIQHSITTLWLDIYGSIGVFSVLVGIVLTGAIVWYVYRLSVRGDLT